MEERKSMKKLIVLLCAVLLCGCTAKPAETAPAEEPAKEETPAETTETTGGAYKVGTGSVTSISGTDVADGAGKVQFNTTYATLVTDADGVIKYVTIDVAQNTANVEDGAEEITVPETSPTKKEKKEDYGMKGASGIGKEWYEQMAAFEEYATGKTVEEVLALPREESGKTTDEDLLTGCTIKMNDYLKAIEKAYNNAAEVEGVANVAAGSETGYSVKGKDSVQANTTMATIATDADGKIVYSAFDVAQNTAALNEDGTWTIAEETPTKKEKGDAYGMKGASAIGKEWFEQIAALEEYLNGKTLDEVTGMELVEAKSTDEDLLTGCTIKLTDYVAAAAKAAANNAAVK